VSTRNGFRVAEQLLLPWSPQNTISASAAARMLNVAISTACAMIQEGTLKGYKINPHKPRSHWRVSYESVLEHLDKVHKVHGLERRF
jgi:excisionase family DNA binding protein